MGRTRDKRRARIGRDFLFGLHDALRILSERKISRKVTGKVYSPNELAALFEYYDKVADNINLVSATQYADGIIKAFSYYTPKNPVVWNTSGFETVETVRALAPYVNVWLPDLKYVDSALSRRLSGKSDYFKYAFDAISEMIRLSGKVKIENGLIKSGVIVRHLILPSHIDNTLAVLKVLRTILRTLPFFRLWRSTCR